MSSERLFAEINNAVLDLQAAQFQTYERPLKRLAQLLNHPDLQAYNEELKKGLDLDEFISGSQRTGGSMVGSSRLIWPDDQNEVLGLQLLLIEKLGQDPDFARHFSFQFFYSGRKFISSIRSLTGQLIIPFARDYKNFVLSRTKTQMTTTQGSASNGSVKSQVITNYGIVVMNSQSVSMENIHNLVQATPDKAIGNALEALATAIVESDLPEEKSTEMLEQVGVLAEQASLAPPNRKMGIIKACWTQLVENADGITKVSNLLREYGPVIGGFFETTLSKFGM